MRERIGAFYSEEYKAFRARIPFDKKLHCNSLNDNQQVTIDAYGNALAYWTGVGSKKQRRNAAKKIAQLVMADEPKSITEQPAMGIGWAQIILQPLLEEGYLKELEVIIKKYYKPYVYNKAKTWGEDFVSNPYNTAHAWGACINILLFKIETDRQNVEIGIE